jgi:hypothetical protein
MSGTTFTAKVRPALHPAALDLVRIYETTPGSTGPGCCPEALAAVLQVVAGLDAVALLELAALLRGEKP